MPPSSRITPLLQPAIRLPRENSILLLTSTLGATANWLIIRFLCDALSTQDKDGGADENRNVALVSWMREYEFWRQEARKGGGLDLERLKQQGRFAFVDGLSGLFLEQTQTPEAERNSQTGVTARTPQMPLPVRGPPGRTIPGRGPPLATPATAIPQASQTAPPNNVSSAPNTKPPGLYTLTSPSLSHLKTALQSATSHLSNRETLVILDNPDTILATDPSLTPSSLTSLFLTLSAQSQIAHLIVHLQADTPLLSLSTPAQPLEVNQHNLLVKTAHMSRRIVSLRVLDTGVARDVSGVLRVTETRDGLSDLRLRGEEDEPSNREVLYKVSGDGNVRVFERGAGGEGAVA